MINIKQLKTFTKNINILYVEDNEDARVGTLKMLSDYFPNIDTAVDGLNGLEKFKLNNYHIIFTDLNMPRMDGIEMIKEIRKIDLQIPVIVLSAHDDKEYFLETIKAGIDGYILKPYDFYQIQETIINIVLKLDLYPTNSNKILLDYEYIWDNESSTLHKNSKVIKLTVNETKLIKLFISQNTHIIDTQNINTQLFSEDLKDNAKIRNLVSRLKTKLGVNLIESNYGQGYILNKLKD